MNPTLHRNPKRLLWRNKYLQLDEYKRPEALTAVWSCIFISIFEAFIWNDAPTSTAETSLRNTNVFVWLSFTQQAINPIKAVMQSEYVAKKYHSDRNKAQEAARKARLYGSIKPSSVCRCMKVTVSDGAKGVSLVEFWNAFHRRLLFFHTFCCLLYHFVCMHQQISPKLTKRYH